MFKHECTRLWLSSRCSRKWFQEEVMALSIVGIEAILARDDLQVAFEDNSCCYFLSLGPFG
ncbi:hypothetical protein SOVF_124080 [Spinacia oleracea]|nr:hypothetical protein SOVF_124080 [Spinacia oleracea]